MTKATRGDSPPGLDRRALLKLGAGAATGVAASALAGCGSSSSGGGSVPTGQLIHGATGGGLKDTLDPHAPVTVPDIARVMNLYEPLLRFTPQYTVEPALAESVEPNRDATEWTFRLRDGVTFHHGKTLTAQDVRFSLERMANPKAPAPYLKNLLPILDLAASKVLDRRTYRLKLKAPYAQLQEVLASYSLGIVPTDFDVAHPVGTGPWKADVFVPGQRSSFPRFDGYWGKRAHFDELVILDFADDAAKVNALLAGQVHTVDNLPAYLVDSIRKQGAVPLVSQTGGWIPLTMRADAGRFKDKRVRQAMRLIVDRQQMIDQAFNGYGRVANDLYSPFDPAYAGSTFPQRHQDIDQAKSLLRAAGAQGMQVELVTSTGVGAGAVESANVFADQARRAGVRVRINKVDSSIFYGDRYLSWTFAQDFWNTRNYIPQAASCALKTSPYNETHFHDERFAGLIAAAQRELDPARRRRLLQDAQRIEYDEGGLIIWAFKNQVDAHSRFITGLTPAREQPVSSYRFNLATPVENA